MPSPIPFLPDETEQVLRPGRLAVYMTVATLCAVAYWYLGTPGPQLAADYERGFDAAVGHMAWAVVFYLVVPLLGARCGSNTRSRDSRAWATAWPARS